MTAWDISSAETALKTWADAKTGITFVPADEHATAPAYPFGTYKILTGPVSAGGMPGLVHKFDAGNASGAELDMLAIEPATVSVSFQAFNDDFSPSASARKYLEDLRNALLIPSDRDTLTNAGMAVVGIPSVQDISDIEGAERISRAAMDVRFNVAIQVQSSETYIETVEGSIDIDNDDGSDEIDDTYTAS